MNYARITSAIRKNYGLQQLFVLFDTLGISIVSIRQNRAHKSWICCGKHDATLGKVVHTWTGSPRASLISFLFSRYTG